MYLKTEEYSINETNFKKIKKNKKNKLKKNET